MVKIKLAGQEVRLPENTIILRPPKSPKPLTFLEAVEEALDNPLDTKPLDKWDLKDKKNAVLVDDWGRPTPCGEFLPGVLKRLNQAGAEDDNITVITASGMHDPMDDEDMRRKVGDEVYKRVRCISHDAGNPEMQTFVGITDLGTPIWINRYVAEADFKMALGRIFPHVTYGYEGGYKMIVPGVASFETIIRDHALNFSPLSDYGNLLNNPSRNEADEIGRKVGLDFLVNYVMDWDGQPVKAFAGTPETVFPAGVDFGQRYVWGVVTGGKLADIVIICNEYIGDLSLSNNPIYYLGMAMSVTKPDGVVISVMDYIPRKKSLVCGYDLESISLSELIRLHEKRDWNLDNRQIQHVLKSIRGAFYERRIFELRSQKLFIVSDTFPFSRLEKWNARQFTTIQQAFDAAIRGKNDATVLVLPDIKHTLPLLRYDYS